MFNFIEISLSFAVLDLERMSNTFQIKCFLYQISTLSKYLRKVFDKN